MIRLSVKAVALACALVMSIAGGAAAAQFGYVGVGAFGASGVGQAEFTSPNDVTVESGSGRIFVTDTGNARVQVFEPGGGSATYLTAITAGLDRPVGVAVDQTSGAVYVSDAGASRIYRFVSDGAPLPTFTVDPTFASPLAGNADGRIGGYAAALAVDPTNGDLLVGDRVNHRISRYSDAGFFRGSISFGDSPLNEPIDLTVDAAGRIYVVDATGDPAAGATSRAFRLNADGSFDGSFEAVPTPGAVAIDPHTGYVLIAGNVNAFAGVRIYSYDGATFVDDVPLPGDNSGTLRGLAVDGGASEQVYALSDMVFGCCGFVGAQVLATVEAPELTISPASGVTATSAHLAGSADPNGRQTTARFETSADGGATWVLVGESQDVGDGSSAVAVEADATDLLSNTEYLVRLTASAAGDLDARTAPLAFTTSAAAPGVTTGAATSAADTSVTLGGRVNANGSATTYWFEYGESASYGGSLPAARDGDAGSGTAPRFVAEPLTGLRPGTTYHYRLVARNAVGEVAGVDRTFTAGDPAGVNADLRHFELVSPPLKGTDAGSRTTSIRSSSDGDRVAFISASPFPGAAGSGVSNDYVASRTGGGWVISSETPRQDPAYGSGVSGAAYADFSSDLTAGVLRAGAPALAPGANERGQNLYHRRFEDPLGAYTLLTSVTGDPIDTLTPAYAAASTDLRSVFFETNLTLGLTPDAPDDRKRQAYVASPAGLRYLGHLPNGSVSADGIVVGRGVASLANEQRAVASDGSRAVLTSGPSTFAERIYLWRDDASVLEVSASQRSIPDPDGPRPAFFMIASTDQERIFFKSGEKLTDDATATPDAYDLYMYERSSGTLTDVTTGDPRGAGVVDVLGASEDGARVYFVATARLAAGAATGEPNLYLWDATSGVRFVTTIEANSDNIQWEAAQNSLSSRVSADGRRLMFVSSLQLSGYDNAGRRQIYLYDATADAISCVSCRPDGRPPTADASVIVVPAGTEAVKKRLPRLLSADGRHVFFNTAEALLPEDNNGVIDVYESVDGRLRLVSSGRGESPARFADATPDGRQVFFTTRARLSAWDVDEYIDLYAARQGGDRLPEPPRVIPPAPCEGSDCQGAPQPRPADPQPGSLTRESPPAGAPVCPSGPALAASISAAQRRRAATSGVLALTVRHRVDGTVSATAQAAVGRRGATRRVASGRAQVDGGRRQTLSLRLSAAARDALASKGRTAVRVTVAFSGRCGGAKTVRVTLRRAATSRARSRARRRASAAGSSIHRVG